MFLNNPGIEENSYHMFLTPSPWAKEALLYPISIGHFRCNERYHVNRTRYNSYLLLKVLAGELHVTQGGWTRVVHGGDAALLDCYRHHAYSPTGGVEFMFVHMDGPNMEPIVRAIEKRNGALIKTEKSSVIETGLVQMMDLLQHAKHIPEEMAASLLYNMLMEMLAYSSPGHARQRQQFPMNQIRDYIEGHLDKQITLKDLSGLSGYSVFHFSRVFKKLVGMSPYQYILACRLDKAKYLLHTTNEKIQAISQLAGFNSEANFSYTFEKHVHMSPSSFRKNGL